MAGAEGAGPKADPRAAKTRRKNAWGRGTNLAQMWRFLGGRGLSYRADSAPEVNISPVVPRHRRGTGDETPGSFR